MHVKCDCKHNLREKFLHKILYQLHFSISKKQNHKKIFFLLFSYIHLVILTHFNCYLATVRILSRLVVTYLRSNRNFNIGAI